LDAQKHGTFWCGFPGFFGIGVRGDPIFFSILSDILQNQFLAVVTLFLHNILIVSLILLGMTFDVNLVVLKFFQKREARRCNYHASMQLRGGLRLLDCLPQHITRSHLNQRWNNP
jgi:hypothetical protein